MNAKHKKTLAAIFANAKSLPFRNVEALLTAVGCDKVEGRGSRVTFAKDTSIWHVHRPHPGNDIKEYQVKDVKGFLEEIGVMP